MSAAIERPGAGGDGGPRVAWWTWWTEVPQWALLVLLFGLAAVSWSAAPERIPVHWNVYGQVDRYGGKAEGLLLLPAIALAVYALLLALPRIDPLRANYAAFAGAYTLIRVAILAVLAAVYGVILLTMRGYAVDVGQAVSLAIGGLFVVLGAAMGRIRRNWFVGIRTPWTLTSDVAWARTHRLAGWLFGALGVLLALTGLVRAQWWMWTVLGGSLAVALFLVIFSYLAWRGDPARGRALGTAGTTGASPDR